RTHSRENRIGQAIVASPVTRSEARTACALRGLMCQALDTKLRVGSPEQRIIGAEVVFQIGIAGLAKEPALIKLLRLPGQQALFDLLRKTIGISSRAECLFGKHARSFVVSVSIVGCAAETRNDNVRTKLPDHTHQIAQCSIVSAPFFDRLVRVLGVAKICNSREAEIHAVIL